MQNPFLLFDQWFHHFYHDQPLLCIPSIFLGPSKLKQLASLPLNWIQGKGQIIYYKNYLKSKQNILYLHFVSSHLSIYLDWWAFVVFSSILQYKNIR